ncbi:MAG: diacylglycerol kinase family protein [Lacibacter sp.]
MQQKIALAINAKAGNGTASKVSARITAILSVKGIFYTAFSDSWPSSFEGFTDVWIIGGDGTLNYFINKYSSINIPLVIFKGGTGNDFSWKLYGDISLEEQISLALNVEAKFVDAATCNRLLYINTVGIGFDGEVLHSMKAIRFLGGHLGYYLVVLQKIFSFREFRYKIYSEGLLADEKFLLVSIANSSRTGGGFHISPKASVNDGWLDLVIVKPLGLLKRIFYLPQIEKGKHLQYPFVHHVIGTEFIIECEKEIAAQLDGDLIVAKRFTFSLLKNKFLFRYK